jgi:hypothetical protein
VFVLTIHVVLSAGRHGVSAGGASYQLMHMPRWHWRMVLLKTTGEYVSLFGDLFTILGQWPTVNLNLTISVGVRAS